MSAHQTLREAQSHFLNANGLPADGGRYARTWTCRVGPFTLVIANFEWRRRAIVRHDLHHVLTGYECGVVGEFEMAAWEFAAGPFKHVCATAFCLPLVAMGAVLAPRRTFAAFVRGRASKTLYGSPVDRELLEMPLCAAQTHYAPARERLVDTSDRWAFLIRVGQGAAILAVPALACVLAWVAAQAL